ncbi:type I-B CRISPR-associated protein Cas5b [Clostridium oryzae]|uniref:CRISPR-associated protein n=1 Tax=Clostridium oryzae TaxID=1450648 RepID=A0A1V4IQI2_9CLOT|nr:type I-B CRISPR-associated protein Cas5b [Clostridium oryzae]OPJ62163.1 CRISPR-associated protein [Clostridium oryzae]
MNVLVFDIRGKFAHFRKYYTNSSSLTYSIPPRTTICGIIATVLGYERDSYYETFSSDNCKIAIKKCGATRKMLHTVNYMFAKNSKEVVDPKKHTQIPFEILTGDRGVIYRIYFSHQNENIMQELERRLKEKKYYFAPYMGAASFNCSIEYIGSSAAEIFTSKTAASIATAVDSRYIVEGGIDVYNSEINLMREKMPRDFMQDRYIKSINSYIFEDEGKTIKMKLSADIYKVKYEADCSAHEENIVFM